MNPTEVAITWAERGVAAFPVLLSPESSGKLRKTPATIHGHHDATTDRERLRTMFANAARRASDEVAVGVGIVPGSGGLLVVDCDGADAVKHADGLGLNSTWTVQTARGEGHEHRYFLAPEGVKVGNARPEGWISTMDIRGSAGWVVAPGTETPWGSWMPLRGPFDRGKVRAIAAEDIRPPERTYEPPTAEPGASMELAEEKLRAMAREMATTGEGSRNETLNRLAYTVGGWVGNADLDAVFARDVLVAAAMEAGLPEGEATSVVERAITDGAHYPTPPTGGGLVLEGLEGEIERLKREREHEVTLRRFPATDLRSLLGDRAPEREWLVEGFMGLGTSTALVAPAGVGKSLLTLKLGLDIALGERFLGMFTRQARVLYIDMENTLVDIAERLWSLGVSEEDGLRLLGQFVYLSLPPFHPFDTRDGAQELAAVVEAYGLGPGDLVVFDSAQRVVAGEESSSDTWRLFYNATLKPLKALGLTILRLDNTGKNEDRGARGSSSKNDDVDVIWQMSKTAQGHVLRQTKGRPVEGVGDMEVIYKKDEDGRIAFRRVATGSDEADIALAMTLLDAEGVPPDAGHHKAWEALKGVKGRPTRAILRRAVQRRKARAESHGPQSGPSIRADGTAREEGSAQ